MNHLKSKAWLGCLGNTDLRIWLFTTGELAVIHSGYETSYISYFGIVIMSPTYAWKAVRLVMKSKYSKYYKVATSLSPCSNIKTSLVVSYVKLTRAWLYNFKVPAPKLLMLSQPSGKLENLKRIIKQKSWFSGLVHWNGVIGFFELIYCSQSSGTVTWKL